MVDLQNRIPAQELSITADAAVRVSGLWQQPADARACLVLAHGAGAGMRHPFMTAVAAELAALGIATLRYQFPYMERGSKRPDPPQLCADTVRAAVAEAARRAPALPRFAGGKSFGGRMTSQAQASAPLAGVRGLAFLGFPLHPPGKPSNARAQHLADVHIPMLFLQGTRDEFADLALLGPFVAGLGERAALTLFEGADHSFHMRARAVRNSEQTRREVIQTLADWMDATASASAQATAPASLSPTGR